MYTAVFLRTILIPSFLYTIILLHDWELGQYGGIIILYEYKKNIFKKIHKDVGMEMPKNIQTRCRDSINTKLNIHSPIPTSACSTVALVYTICHVLYQAVLEMSSIPTL